MDRWTSLGSDLGRAGPPREVGRTWCLLESLVRMKSEVVLVPPHLCRWDVTSGKTKHLERAVAGRSLKTPALVFHLSGASPHHHGAGEATFVPLPWLRGLFQAQPCSEVTSLSF